MGEGRAGDASQPTRLTRYAGGRTETRGRSAEMKEAHDCLKEMRNNKPQFIPTFRAIVLLVPPSHS